MICASLLLAFFLALDALAYIVLKPKAYIQLNDRDGNKRINSSTLNTLDFDYATNILYVVAHEPARMTVFSLAADGTPTQIMEHAFNTALEGFPLDIEICRPVSFGSAPRVAISFQDPASRSADGRVVFYQPLSITDVSLREIQRVTVGPFPIDLEFAEDCAVLVAANKGQPTKEGTNSYRDPEGSITKLQLGTDFSESSPVLATTIGFSEYFMGDVGLANYMDLMTKNFRAFPIRDPLNNVLSVEQNLEPEDIIITENGLTAWVTLPVNNAIAVINLFTNQVSSIKFMRWETVPGLITIWMPAIWTKYYFHSEGVNMRGYNIHSLYQARRTEWIKGNNKNDFLITLDSGMLHVNHEYGFVDFERGKTLQQAGVFDTGDSKLEAQLGNDTLLGRLAISTVNGARPDGLIQNAFTFGGRGFSIHSIRNMGIGSTTVDSIEKVTKQYLPDVFNSAYRSPTSNPQRDRDSSSPFGGPYLQGLEVGEFNGKTVVFLGGGYSGIIYVYVLSADSRCPEPCFHSLYRAGGKFSSWQTLYDTADMGDIDITDMRYLEDVNLVPIRNSLSIYTVEEGPFDEDNTV